MNLLDARAVGDSDAQHVLRRIATQWIAFPFASQPAAIVDFRTTIFARYEARAGPSERCRIERAVRSRMVALRGAKMR